MLNSVYPIRGFDVFWFSRRATLVTFIEADLSWPQTSMKKERTDPNRTTSPTNATRIRVLWFLSKTTQMDTASPVAIVIRPADVFAPPAAKAATNAAVTAKLSCGLRTRYSNTQIVVNSQIAESADEGEPDLNMYPFIPSNPRKATVDVVKRRIGASSTPNFERVIRQAHEDEPMASSKRLNAGRTLRVTSKGAAPVRAVIAPDHEYVKV
jgi:hypothetical protein